MPMHRLRVLTIACTLLSLVSIGVGQDEKGNDDPITVGRDTTFFIEPLTEDGRVDLLKALNNHLAEGVTSESNALVPLVKILGPKLFGGQYPEGLFEAIGMEKPADDSQFMEFAGVAVAQDEFEPALAGPWTREQLPEMARWVDDSEKHLDGICEALKRPHLYTPLVQAEDDPSLVSILLPQVQSYRSIARGLLVRAHFAMGEGRYEAARQDLLAMHRLASLTSRGSTLIETLVGVAIDGMASNGDAQLISQQTQMVQFYEQMQRELQELEPMQPIAEQINLGERLLMIDLISRMARGDAGGEQAFGADLPAWMTVLLRRSGLLDWNELLRTCNQKYDEFVEALRIEEVDERQEKVAGMLAKLQEKSRALSTPAGWAELLKGDKSGLSEGFSAVMLSLLMPAVNAASTAEIRSQSYRDVAVVALAIRRYRSDKGEYPERLEQLAPAYLDEIPLDRMVSEPFKYKSSADGFVIYTVGRNRTDDGGPSGDETIYVDDWGVQVGVVE